MPSRVPDGITYPFPNFNGCNVKVWIWTSNFIPQFIMHGCNYSSMLGFDRRVDSIFIEISVKFQSVGTNLNLNQTIWKLCETLRSEALFPNRGGGHSELWKFVMSAISSGRLTIICVCRPNEIPSRGKSPRQLRMAMYILRMIVISHPDDSCLIR